MLFNGAFTLLTFCKTCTNEHDSLAICHHLICDKLRGGLDFHLVCAETEGMKRRIFEGFDEPERVYQCVSGEIKLVEYLWNRYEKK